MINRSLAIILLLGASTLCQAQTFYGPTHLGDQKFEDLSIFGPAELNKITADSLTVHGALAFDNLTAPKKLEVFGPTEGKNSNVGDITVAGPLQLDHCKVKSLNIAGPFRAKHLTVENTSSFIGPFEVLDSHFQDLSVTADKAAFANTQVKNIVMKKNNDPKEQIISLSGTTVVSGDITFEAGKGQVMLDKTAKLQGKVKGGTLNTK